MLVLGLVQSRIKASEYEDLSSRYFGLDKLSRIRFIFLYICWLLKEPVFWCKVE